MNFYKLYFLLFFIVFVCSAQAQQERYDRIRIHLDASHTIRQLGALGVEVDHGALRKGVSVTSDFSATEERTIGDAGFSYDVLIRDVAAYYVQQNTNTQGSGQRAVTCSSPAGYNVQTPANFRTGTMGGFLTYPEMLDQLDSMHAKYPNLISARNVIDTFHSIEGRPIYWMRISNHPDSNQTAKPEIFYTALHHAREPAGLTDMIFYMWYLLENYQTSAEVKGLVDNTEMFIVPCVNPDGYIYNHTTDPNGGGLWRKNRRHNADSTYGVDLNRNYGYNWGYDNSGSSPTTTDDTYRGTAGFSEPEIAAVKWFAEHHNFKIAVNYHTYSNMLIYPWGYQASFLTPDSALFESYARTMTKYNGFLYGTGDQTVGYLTNGDSDDWMYGEQVTKNKVLSMTPESGSAAFGFWPPASAVVDVCKENFDLIYYAHKFLLRHLEIKDISQKIATNPQYLYKFQAQRLGLDSPASYSIHLVSSDPNVTVPASLHNIANPALLQTVTDSFLVQLNPSMTTGTSFSFEVVINNGLYTYVDTITRKYIKGDTIYYNDCSDVSTITPTGTWGQDFSDYTSAPSSFSDSPGSNYPDNSDTKITLVNAIDLTTSTTATLLFQTKWQIEKDYDYAMVEASADSGATWNALCGLYTSIGTNQGNSTQSIYDGYQLSWVQEVIDLGDYAGKKINLRFHLVSDQYVNYAGFSFDDLTILGNDSSHLTSVKNIKNNTANWQLYPNPATDKVMIQPTALNGEEILIYDAVGAEVKKTKVTNSSIILTDIAPGAYSVMINNTDYVHSIRKLIVIR